MSQVSAVVRANRRVAELLVTQAGAQCTSAEGGAAALKEASTQPPDVVLMDCEMPDMDGFATTSELLKEAPDDHKPIIVAVSAHTDDDNEYSSSYTEPAQRTQRRTPVFS